MNHRQRLLSDEQWELIEPLFPVPKRRRDKRGRPWAANRACLEGILWILQTGAAWRFLPSEFPSPSTCWRRLQRWEEQGVWLKAWRAFLGALDKEGLLDWEESFLDGSFEEAALNHPEGMAISGDTLFISVNDRMSSARCCTTASPRKPPFTRCGCAASWSASSSRRRATGCAGDAGSAPPQSNGACC